MTPPEPEQPFAQPWHAELFAATHALAQAGAFAWTDWAAWFGAALAEADAAGAPKDGSTYYEIWLAALEEFLAARGLADRAALSGLRDDWEAAYLATPHGEPVDLPGRTGRTIP